MKMGKMAYLIFGMCLVISTTLAKPGGWSPVDVNSQSVQDIASFATNELASRSNSMYESKLLNVVSAQSQVWFAQWKTKLYEFSACLCLKIYSPSYILL